ncbi:ABC transporter substrate-binding protein [Brooklawnia cerclae]|uniref:NitT/TauT family transport system substrate-binding protein n=1 Tax=Brooklawnia cerclae TaxID=349934 RepID=A0ABX0SJC1_9ACTN|nr:ABC transporter substrate-binding protein [Brooklawnia cerclae]NIH56741.1 NitT/TauT family transport system substrate-binding protein [Brooklawnia cerclae]
MKLSRRAFLGVAAAAGLVACAPNNGGSSASSSSGGGTALTLGLTYVPDIQFAPVYVAHKQGWYAEAGLDVTLRHHGANEQLLGALQTGDEDVVYAGGGEMLQARGEGIPVVDFATLYQQYPVAVIVPDASPVRSLSDLRGHSIGLPGEYGENWYCLLAVLAQAGLTRDDLDIQSIGYTQHAALTGGKVDSVVGYVNNDVVRFGEAGFAIRTLTVDDPPLVSVGFGTLDDTLAARPDDLRALLAGTEKGASFCAQNPAQAVELSSEYIPTLTDDDQKAVAQATLTATMPLYQSDRFGQQDAGRWGRMATFFASNGLVSQEVPAEEAFSTVITEG